MTGNAHQRRIRRRLQERLSKRAMSEGRYPWLESSLAQPEKPAEAEKAISAAPALRSGEVPLKGEAEDTSKPIAPPEPRGEAEGAKAGDMVQRLREHLESTPPDQLRKEWEQIRPKKRRTLWNWLRKLVGR